MKSLPAIAVAFSLIISLCGCDYTRRGGAYRLTFLNDSTQNSTIKVETDDGETVRRIVERWLSGGGFQEFKYNETRAVWRKGGARVYVTRETKGEVMIEVSAMGYKRDLRLSEQTERELLAYLEKQTALKIILTTPPVSR